MRCKRLGQLVCGLAVALTAVFVCGLAGNSVYAAPTESQAPEGSYTVRFVDKEENPTIVRTWNGALSDEVTVPQGSDMDWVEQENHVYMSFTNDWTHNGIPTAEILPASGMSAEVLWNMLNVSDTVHEITLEGVYRSLSKDESQHFNATVTFSYRNPNDEGSVITTSWTGYIIEPIEFPTVPDTKNWSFTGWLDASKPVDVSNPVTVTDLGYPEVAGGVFVRLDADYVPIVRYSFDADGMDPVTRDITVYRGQTFKVRHLLKGTGACLVAQVAIPYDDEVMFEKAVCDRYSNTQVQLDLYSECVNMMRSGMKLTDAGFVTTEFTMRVREDAPAGDFVLTHAMAMAFYKINGVSLEAVTDLSETLTIHVSDRAPIDLPEGDGYVYDGEEGGPFANEDYHGRIEPYDSNVYEYTVSYSNADTSKTDVNVEFEAATGKFVIPGADVTANLIITVNKTPRGTMEYKAYAAGVGMAVWKIDKFAANNTVVTYKGRNMQYHAVYGGYVMLFACTPDELASMTADLAKQTWGTDLIVELPENPGVVDYRVSVHLDINNDKTAVNLYDAGYLMNVFKGAPRLVKAVDEENASVIQSYLKCDLNYDGVVNSDDFSLLYESV